MSPQKGLELVGNNLQKQYFRWQPRARYKQLLDPTTDEVRKLCLALRKNAKVGNCHKIMFNASNGTSRSMSVSCFTTMVMESQSQHKMERFGCSIK